MLGCVPGGGQGLWTKNADEIALAALNRRSSPLEGGTGAPDLFGDLISDTRRIESKK